MLEIRGLSAGWERRPVIEDIDLDVHHRETVAVVGPSSAGKSTLLAAISGLARVLSGSVKLFGIELAGLPPEDIVAKGVAHVPERRRLFGGLSVRDNLLLGAWCQRRPSLDVVLDLFPSLVQNLDRPAGSLSGGEQQLCALARGLMSQPLVLLVDELSLGLAPLTARQVLHRLPDIAAAGTAVLIVDQDPATALSVAERGYVLDAGRAVATGASGRLLADPHLRAFTLGSG